MPAFDLHLSSSSAAGPTIASDSIYNSFHHQSTSSYHQPSHHILKHLISQPQTNTGTGVGNSTTATTGGGSVGGAVGVIGGGGGGNSGATTFGGTTYYGDGVGAGAGAGGVMSGGYGGPLGGNSLTNHGGVGLPVAFATAYGMQQQQQPDGLGSALGGGVGHHTLGNIGLGGFVGHPPPHLGGLGMPGVSAASIGLGGALGGNGGSTNVLGGGWGNAGTTPERISNNRPRRDRSTYQQQHPQHPQQHQTPTRLDQRLFSSVFNNNNLLQSTPSIDRGNAILSGQPVGGMSIGGGGTRRRIIDEDGYGNFGDGDGHNQHTAFPNSLSIQNVGSVNTTSHLHSETNHVHHSYHPVHDLSLERCRNVFLKSDDSNSNSGGTFASSNTTSEHAKKPKWEVLEIVGNVRNLSPQIFQLQQLTCLVVCNNQLMTLSSDIRHLVNLEHLNIAHNRIKVLPPAIGDLVLMRELIASGNLIRSLPPEMGRLFKLNVLELSGNPLTPETLAALAEGVSNLLTTLQNGLDVDAVPPPPREWLPAELPLSYRERAGMMPINSNHMKITVPLRVLCYNILCPHYCSRQLYGYCPSWALKWDYRVRGIQLELKGCSADLLCLQEVETGSYHKTFQPKLSECGYDSEFTPKTRARTMQLAQDRVQVDGCAVFWRRNKFQMLDKRTLEFSQLAMQHANGNTDMLNRVMTRDNVASVVLLRVKHSWFEERRRRRLESRQKYHHHDDNKENHKLGGKSTSKNDLLTTTQEREKDLPVSADNNDDDTEAGEDWGDDDEDDSVPPEELCPFLIVVSAHFHWDPDFCDVKLIQAVMLTSEIRRCILEWSQKYLKSDDAESDAFPVVLCGDLNSLPDSGVIDFLRSGSVSTRHEDFRRIDYVNALKPLSQRQAIPERITHGFKFWDVYHIAGKPLKFTNYTFDFQGLIDYIFVSQSIKVTGVLGPIDSGWTRDQHVVGFPHPHVPSDHLPLMSTLRVPLLDKLSSKAVQLLRAAQQLAAKSSGGNATNGSGNVLTPNINGGSNNTNAGAGTNNGPQNGNHINRGNVGINGFDRQSSHGSHDGTEIYYDAKTDYAESEPVYNNAGTNADDNDVSFASDKEQQASLSAASSALSLEGIVLEDYVDAGNKVDAPDNATTLEHDDMYSPPNFSSDYPLQSSPIDAVMTMNSVDNEIESDSNINYDTYTEQPKYCTSVEQQENNEMLCGDMDEYGPHLESDYDADAITFDRYAAALYHQHALPSHESAESINERYEHFSESVGLSPKHNKQYTTPSSCTNFMQSPRTPIINSSSRTRDNNTHFIPNLVQLARSAAIAAHTLQPTETVARTLTSSSPSSSIVLSPSENENEHQQRWNYFAGDAASSSHDDGETLSR